jgi:hypothetical protein
MHRLRRTLVCLAALVATLASPALALAAPTAFKIYLVWWKGQQDDQRKEMDSYIDCLVRDTTYPKLFDAWGGATFTYGGSVDITESPPGSPPHFGICDGDWAFTTQLIQKGQMDGSFPGPTTAAIPVYVFMNPSSVHITNCAPAGCTYSSACPGICFGPNGSKGATVGLNTGDLANTDLTYGCSCYKPGKSFVPVWVSAKYCGFDGSDPNATLADVAATAEHEIAEGVSAALGVINHNSGNGAIGDACSISGFLDCPNRPGVVYATQPYSEHGTCDFHTSVNGNSCAPQGWGCGWDKDCCSGLRCTKQNGYGGTLCAPATGLSQLSGNEAMTLVSWTNDGHPEIFLKTKSGTAVHVYPMATSDTWTMFYDLDSPSTCGAAAGFWPDQGYAELFDPAPDGTPQHLFFDTKNGWSKWTHDMTAPPTPLAHMSTLVWPDGHMEVLALGGDGAIWHTHLAQGVDKGWAAWQSLGGSFVTGAAPIVAGDGHAELFATDATGAAWHAWSGSGADFPNGWHAWASLGGALASRPVPVRWADGHIEVFATGKDGQLYASDDAMGTWPAFQALSPGLTIQGEPSAIMNDTGQGASAGPEVFARDASGKVVHLWWAGTGYTAFTPHFDQAAASDPFAWIRSDGKAEVFSIDGSGQLTRSYHDGTNGWTMWSPIGGTDLDPCLPAPAPDGGTTGAGGASGTGGASPYGTPGSTGGCRCRVGTGADEGAPLAAAAVAGLVALVRGARGRRRRAAARAL